MNIVDKARETITWATKEGSEHGSLYEDEANRVIAVAQGFLDCVECLEDLTRELTEGTNLGKSWSEYQVNDSVVEMARAVLLRLRGEN